MAIYKRTYRAYAGELTPEWSRFWVLTRYAWRFLFRSRAMTGFFILCFFPPLIMAIGLYMVHNPTLLKLVHLTPEKALINFPSYFQTFLQIQASFALLLTA